MLPWRQIIRYCSASFSQKRSRHQEVLPLGYCGETRNFNLSAFFARTLDIAQPVKDWNTHTCALATLLKWHLDSG